MGNNYLDTAKKLLNIAEELKSKEYSQGEIATAYERAGDAYKLAGKPGSATEFYKTSKNYAHDEKIKERLRDKITGNYPIEKIKANVQRINLSSLEKEAGIGVKIDDKKKKKDRFVNFHLNWDNISRARYPKAILSIASFVFALFFISTNLTGYATSLVSVNDSKWLGFCFFACGLIFAFIFLNSKKRF